MIKFDLDGLKPMLMGEFYFMIDVPCPECIDEGFSEDCTMCGGLFTVSEKHFVPWTTVKEILAKIEKLSVDLCVMKEE